MLRALLSSLIGLALWVSPLTAQGAETRPSSKLTGRGRFMPSGSVTGFWSNDEPSNYGSFSTWTLSLAPSLVYFLRDNVGLGALLAVSYAEGGPFPNPKVKDRGLSLGVIAVWNVPLGGRFSLMLRPFLGYAQEWTDSTFQAQPSFYPDDPPELQAAPSRLRQRLSYIRLALGLPFVYAITDSVGVGFGPELTYDRLFGETTDLGAGSLSSGSNGNRVRMGANATLFASF